MGSGSAAAEHLTNPAETRRDPQGQGQGDSHLRVLLSDSPRAVLTQTCTIRHICIITVLGLRHTGVSTVYAVLAQSRTSWRAE